MTSDLIRAPLLVLVSAFLPWSTARHPNAHVRPGAEDARHNVLVILTDDLGQRDLGAYGDLFPNPDAPPTPHIDGLVADGVRFTRVHANPSCSPTRATLLTGRYGFRTGVGSGVPRDAERGLRRSEVTLPEVLREAGYRSVCIGKWHLSVQRNESGFLKMPNRHGFDDYLAGSLFSMRDGEPPYHNWYRVDNGVLSIEPGYATKVQVDAAREWIRGREEPWFAFVALNSPHVPIHAPPAELLPKDHPAPTTDREKYDAMIVATDALLGELLAEVDRSDTTVIFLSDNGTNGESSQHELQDPDKLKGSPYRESVEVPFIVTSPWVSRGGRSCDALVNTTDLFSTVLELAGVERPAGAAEDSVSIVPYLKDPDLADLRPWVLVEFFRPNGAGPYEDVRRAIREPRFKLMRIDGEELLFDLDADPFERRDLLAAPLLAPEAKEAHERLRAQLDRLTKR